MKFIISIKNKINNDSKINLLNISIIILLFFKVYFIKSKSCKNNLENTRQISKINSDKISKLKSFLKEISSDLNSIQLNSKTKFDQMSIVNNENSKADLMRKHFIKRNFMQYKFHTQSNLRSNMGILNSKIECPLGTGLNGFHLFDNFLTTENNIGFEYNCYKNKYFVDKFKKYKTKKIIINKNELKSNLIKYLLNLKVKCPEEYVISGFSLEIKENKIYYRYTCVETNVENELCHLSDSNRIQLKQLKNIKNLLHLNILKGLHVSSMQGKFLKFFKLKFDKKTNEIYYRIKSCRVDGEDSEDESDPDVDFEEDEEEESNEINEVPLKIRNNKNYKLGDDEEEDEDDDDEVPGNYEIVRLKIPASKVFYEEKKVNRNLIKNTEISSENENEPDLNIKMGEIEEVDLKITK